MSDALTNGATATCNDYFNRILKSISIDLEDFDGYTS